MLLCSNPKNEFRATANPAEEQKPSKLQIEVEKSSYCRRTIQARMQEGHFSKSCKIFDDVCTFRCQDVEQDEPLDGLTGGFPCQAGIADSYFEWCPMS